MRPVIRGAVPLNADGSPKKVSDYKDWRMDLLDRMGPFCSYCNMVLHDSPQVEHVIAQDINPAVKLEWDNMLLACGPCNRSKSNHPCPPDTHCLPDIHNGHLAFRYIVLDHPKKAGLKACIPIPNTALPQNLQEKAKRTIDLCKLDALTYNPRATDLRWKYRWETLSIAQVWRQSWDSTFSLQPETLQSQYLNLLTTAALAKGFFSIWLAAFEGAPFVLQTLINVFPNTDNNSFDAQNGWLPKARAGLNDL